MSSTTLRPSARGLPRLGAPAGILLACLLFPGHAPLAAQAVPSPRTHFGFEMGSEGRLADWTALAAYYDRLGRSSSRVRVDTLGTTTQGRPFVMLTITSPENQRRLEELRQVQMRLADPRRVSSDAELGGLLDEGRVVVLITHAIHSTEVGSSQVAARLAHRLASSNDPRILRILDEVVILQIPSLNPDGTEWVADWYNRWRGTEFEGASLPWLYHYYVGHDNNRDWYAFTQRETELAITGAHNAWHPQIVHDIHQMGTSGARIFFPPYVDPVERNVDPALVAAVNQLGTYMAARLIAQGKTGVVVGAIYDAFTPARAYQHYHAGARILSETASARLASTILLSPDEVRGGRGYDAATPSWNFPVPWPGGRWGLPQIVDYMESGALALLDNAARNRRYWLENFYRIGERAVQGWERWPRAWVIPAGEARRNPPGLSYLLRVLALGDVEVRRARNAFTAGGERYAAGSWVVEMNQPYAAFAQTLLEAQEYPDLREYEGGPPRRPYDVTAHTLPLLMDVEAVPVEERVQVALSEPIDPPEWQFRLPAGLRAEGAPRIGVYKPWGETMAAGWTRWVLDRHELPYDTLSAEDVRRGALSERYDVILFQSQAAGAIREGLSRGRVPPEYAGGIGSEGARALRDFVRSGGRLVAVEEAVDLAVELFDLRVGNAVERLPSQEFYVPGSILQIEVEEGHPLTRGVAERIPAWYGNDSRAFDVRDPTIRVLARYAGGNPLLSGWILGPQYIAGKPALLEVSVGRGSVVLFGFQPNYRAQSVVTWPLLFNALTPTHTRTGER